MSSVMQDRSGNTSSEHVSSSFTPDANALREAALKSRRKKQSTKKQSAIATGQQTTVNTPQPLVIPENYQGNKTGGIDPPEIDAREKTPRPPSTTSRQSIPSSSPTKAPEYVRPGLNMTARDLNEAKHLILDLLGLGVTPEYLVDCGVSSQCLAVCFYELNLRFPLNLDRRKINLPPFYDLDKHMKDSQRREQIIRQRDRGRVPPRPTPLVTITTEDMELSRTSKSPPPVSFESGERPAIIESSPIAPLNLNIDQSVDIELTGSQSDGAAQPSSSKGMDTTSMEDQKRMELLARKAAMDSITKKRAAKNSGLVLNSPRGPVPQPPSMEIKDVESAVDAFVASVRMDSESSNRSEDRFSKERENQSASGDQLPEYDSDAMVEDELETRSPSLSDPETIDQSMDTPILADIQRNSSPEPIGTNTPALILSPKLALPRVRFDAPDSARSSSLPARPTPVAVPVVARRSRPIASDFIDQAPPRPADTSISESERMTLLKRKRSFVDPAVWPKRIVIDLDSSDEEDDQDEGTPSGATGSSSSSSKGSVDRVPSRTGSHDKSTMAGQDQAAQMLLEKELQIKAMMQKIKMRELQKRKSASGSRTPVPTAGTPAAAADLDKATTPSAEPTLSPAALTANLMPMVTPNSEGPPTIPAVEQAASIPAEQVNHPAINGPLITASPEVNKGKGKALEPEGIPQDNVPVTSAAQADDIIQLERWSRSNNEQAPTHFKAYVSPLAGFTSPNLQRSSPTDQQLSAILWISSPASQNADRQLCMYEFPSGICRSQGCKDIHARDFGASDDEIRKTTKIMFPNARPESITEIVTRVRQSIQPN
ncbi:hypothetical protein OPQ81_006751 [Rhizoctonia solani]|nr:hypothetical protein OPQ81_006751 [Rhizoctonia solani]